MFSVAPQNSEEASFVVPPTPSSTNDTPSLNATENDELRLLVVSNRLPVTITKDANGAYQYKMSSGGLVSALSGLKRMMKFTWIGWPGLNIPEEDRALVQKELLEKHSCLPVFIDDEIADMHYNGFSNRYGSSSSCYISVVSVPSFFLSHGKERKLLSCVTFFLDLFCANHEPLFLYLLCGFLAFCGHSSITIPVKSRSTRRTGVHTSRPTHCLPKPSPRLSATVIWSGFRITT